MGREGAVQKRCKQEDEAKEEEEEETKGEVGSISACCEEVDFGRACTP